MKYNLLIKLNTPRSFLFLFCGNFTAFLWQFCGVVAKLFFIHIPWRFYGKTIEELLRFVFF